MLAKRKSVIKNKNANCLNKIYIFISLLTDSVTRFLTNDDLHRIKDVNFLSATKLTVFVENITFIQINNYYISNV